MFSQRIRIGVGYVLRARELVRCGAAVIDREKSSCSAALNAQLADGDDGLRPRHSCQVSALTATGERQHHPSGTRAAGGRHRCSS